MKLCLSAPAIIRYLRSKELLPSQQKLAETSMRKLPESKLKYEKKNKIPIIENNRNNANRATSTTTERLLNRPIMRHDPSLIRRPPRRLILNVTHETIVPVTIYG